LIFHRHRGGRARCRGRKWFHWHGTTWTARGHGFGQSCGGKHFHWTCFRRRGRCRDKTLLPQKKATGAAEAAEAAAEADPSASEKAAGAAEAEAPARCNNSWFKTVSNMKFEPVTCVHGRRLCTRLTASHGSNLYAIMAYAAVHVPARWAPARQWIRTFSLRRSELLTKRYNCSKAGNTGRVSGATQRHQCGAPTRPCHSGAGMLAETLTTSPMEISLRNARSLARM